VQGFEVGVEVTPWFRS